MKEELIGKAVKYNTATHPAVCCTNLLARPGRFVIDKVPGIRSL